MTQAKIDLVATDKTAAAFASAASRFDGLQASAGAAIARMAALTAAVTTVVTAVQSLNVIAVLDQLDDLAEKTGIATERLSELRYAGEASGTSQETLAMGYRQLAKFIGEVNGGNKESTAIFEELGLKMGTTDEILLQLADRFIGFEDGLEKADLAAKIFGGRVGQEMLPVLNQGSVGINRLSAEARALGAVLNGESAAAAAKFNDNLVKIKLAGEGAAATLAGPMVQALADMSTAYINAKRDGEGTLQTLRNIIDRAPALKNALGSIPLIGPQIAWLNTLTENQTGAKTTAQIQAMVNNLGGANAGGGRGFVNPKVAVPRLPGDAPKAAGGAKSDPLAQAKAYLMSLQEQLDKTRELTLAEQVLEMIQRGKFEAITPQLQQQILDTAKLIDAQKAAEASRKKFEEDAKKREQEEAKRTEERNRLVESVETPFERYQRVIAKLDADTARLGLTQETAARLATQAWLDYTDTLTVAAEKVDLLAQAQQQFAADLTNAMGDTLYDVMQGRFDSIGDRWKSMLDNMVANALAAKLGEKLFGAAGGDGGLLGQLFNAGSTSGNNPSAYTAREGSGGSFGNFFGGLVSSLFGGLPKFETGTSFVDFTGPAMLHYGERVVPRDENWEGPHSGGGGTTIVQNFAGRMDRRTHAQVARDTEIAIERARRLR